MTIGYLIVGLILGGGVGFWLARRARDPVMRMMEAQLAARAAEDVRVDALTHQLSVARADFARADGVGKLLREQFAALEGRALELQQRLAVAEGDARSGEARLRGLEEEVRALEPAQERAQSLAAELARSEAQLEAERSRAEERAVELERGRQTMRLEFEALAQKLLEEKGRSMLEQSHKGLEGLLVPVRERLKEFEEKIQSSAEREGRDRASLLERLKLLQETQTRLHEDAAALSRALTGEARAQGDWGELVLESLLASAGLTEGREYELQVDRLDDEGSRKRPDALVYLPPNRAIVIDAKCSLQAFVASTRAVSEEERESDLEAHVASLRTHVKLLSAKDYTAMLKERSLDFVFLFVPSEAAFHAALSRCPTLSEEAMRQRVVVCSPTTVLATLQMVHHVWRSERQSDNAQRIADEAGKMIDKLSSALSSLGEVGHRLSQAQHAFDDARARFSTGKGHVLSIATRVLELGARANKPERLEAVKQTFDSEPETPELDEPAQAQLQLEAEV